MTKYLILLIVAAGAVGAALWRAHHAGYAAGQRDRVAYDEPLIAAAYEAKAKAEAKVDALDKAARTITTEMEAKHAQTEKTLAARELAARSRIVELLRQRSAAPGAAGCGAVPGVPSGGALDAGAAAGDGRDERFATSISRVGGRCEHDAAELADWHAWYARQKALSERGPE